MTAAHEGQLPSAGNKLTKQKASKVLSMKSLKQALKFPHAKHSHHMALRTKSKRRSQLSTFTIMPFEQSATEDCLCILVHLLPKASYKIPELP
jgi:hypothetical protein